MDIFNKELCEERHHRTQETLDKHESKIDDLERCTRKLEPMVENQELICLESRKRLKKIEHRPMDMLIKASGYAASVLAGAIASVLIRFFGA